MSTFSLTRGSEAALGMLASQAGTETLLLTQPARELRASLTIEPFTSLGGGMLMAELYMREQRHSMTLQRDDGANVQHLADWIEAVANGTVDTAEAIPQRTTPAPLLPCSKCNGAAIGYDYSPAGSAFVHGVRCRHRTCQAVEGAETEAEAHDAWNAIQLEQLADPSDLQAATAAFNAAAHELNAQAETAPAQDEREAPEVVAWLREWKAGNRGGTDPGLCKTSLDGLRKRLGADAEIVSDEPLMTVAQHERIVASLTRPAQTEQQPDGEAFEIVASAVDGPCREVESIDDMAQIICRKLAEAGFLRVRKSEAANFAAPLADVLCRFGLSRDDAEALGAELAIALIPHLAHWDEEHHATPLAPITPQPEQCGLVEALAEAAQSLETISNGAGKDEFMQDMADVRGYARSRAGIARAALATSPTA